MIKEMLGKDVLDKHGKKLGKLDDMVFDDKDGRITHIVTKGLPLMPSKTIQVEDIASFIDVIMLKKTKEEL